MSHNRRQFLTTTLAAGSAAMLAACGGGGDSGPPPTRLMSVLNLNPEAPSADVTFGSALVGSGLAFPGLTPTFEIEYGLYTVSVLNTITSKTSTFASQRVDAASSAVRVFYRDARLIPATTVLGFEPHGLVNLSDITGQLDFDLWEGNASPSDLLQTETLGFEQHADQRSSSSTCRLRIFPAGGDITTLVYDSGEQVRTDAILVYPRFPLASGRSGELAVVGLRYLSTGARIVQWPNLLG